MTQTETQTRRRRDREVLESLAVIFAGGIGGYLLLVQVRGLLITLGLSEDSANWLATMTAGGNRPSELGVPMGPCQAIEAEHANAWLALYLVAAAERLMDAEALTFLMENAPTLSKAMATEERYFGLHVAAEERRMRAAALQDMAARLLDDRQKTDLDLLNWHTVIDNRTTYECRQANGRNFRADRMPLIGWPGAVHMHCRCTAGPPVPGAPEMPSV